MRKLDTFLQWISFFNILCRYSSGITVHFSNNGGTIAGVPLSISQSDFIGGWDALFVRLKTEIPSVVEYQSSTEDWSEYKLYDGNGTMLESPQDLAIYDDEYMYVVPKNRFFYWPHVRTGHRAYLKNTVADREVILESVTGSPRLFYVHNFISEEESDSLINNALTLTGHNGLHRSTTGDGDLGADSQRTSDNAWDLDSATAVDIGERIFGILRMPYKRENMDGLQIVRYLQKQAYRHHHDYFPIGSGNMNYDAANGGSNRYATFFIYLNDVEEGGQTMFPEVPVFPDSILDELDPELAGKLSSHKDLENVTPTFAEIFEPNSWEDQMAKKCYNILSVKPKKAQAVLFYDFTPDWKVDPMSLHGGCPVLNGTKWGANAWVWNGPRPDDKFEPLSVLFTNKCSKTGTIWWKTMEVGTMIPGETSAHGTFDTHKFRFEIDGVEVWSHRMSQTDGKDQKWDITERASRVRQPHSQYINQEL